MNKNLKCWDDKKNNLNKNLNDDKIMKKSYKIFRKNMMI